MYVCVCEHVCSLLLLLLLFVVEPFCCHYPSSFLSLAHLFQSLVLFAHLCLHYKILKLYSKIFRYVSYYTR